MDSSGFLRIIGNINYTKIIYLFIPSNIKVGSFSIASGAGNAIFYTGDSNDYEGNSGTLTLTSLSNSTIAGTFQFDGTNAMNGDAGNATDGTFSMSYISK